LRPTLTPAGQAEISGNGYGPDGQVCRDGLCPRLRRGTARPHPVPPHARRFRL